MRTHSTLMSAAGLALLLAGCAPAPGESSSPGGSAAAPAAKSGARAKRVFLTDRFGERFDITHAIEKYGFEKRFFEFGIGKNTIVPINNPKMLSPGDPGYPPQWGRQDVIGTSIEGEARSYPVRQLTRHEISNETIGETVLAVAY